MIVVKTEMWPGGDESKKYDLGRTYIYNSGGDNKKGDYQVRVCRKGDYAPSKEKIIDGKGCTRTGEVFKYPRLAYNMWRLVIRSLLSAFPEENPKKKS